MKLSFILVVMLYADHTLPIEGRCTNGEIFPDSSDASCKRYLFCNKGRFVKQTCFRDFVYSKTINTCVPPLSSYNDCQGHLITDTQTNSLQTRSVTLVTKPAPVYKYTTRTTKQPYTTVTRTTKPAPETTTTRKTPDKTTTKITPGTKTNTTTTKTTPETTTTRKTPDKTTTKITPVYKYTTKTTKLSPSGKETTTTTKTTPASEYTTRIGKKPYYGKGGGYARTTKRPHYSTTVKHTTRTTKRPDYPKGGGYTTRTTTGVHTTRTTKMPYYSTSGYTAKPKKLPHYPLDDSRMCHRIYLYRKSAEECMPSDSPYLLYHETVSVETTPGQVSIQTTEIDICVSGETFPVWNNCYSYYHCSNGKLEKRTCVFHFVYSKKMKRCVPQYSKHADCKSHIPRSF